MANFQDFHYNSNESAHLVAKSQSKNGIKCSVSVAEKNAF